jgi:hypothetical protein
MRIPTRRLTTAIALLGAAPLLHAPVSHADTLTFDSINTSASPYHVNVTTTGYLQQYGISLTDVTAGSVVNVFCANAEYNSSCTQGMGALTAESGPNVLGQQGVNTGQSYSLDFSTPLSTLSFYTAGWNGGQGSNGLLVAQWSATAYGAGNAVLSSVGQSMASYYSNIAPTQWTLNGPGITAVTFYSQCDKICGENLAIDNLSSPQLSLASVPEPPTLLLFAAGALGLLAWRRARLRHNRSV